MERVVRKEKPSLPPACPHPFPSFLSEIVGMMLEYNPTERPSIRMICQGIEDVLSPPPRIEIEATDQQSLVESQATSTDDEFLRALAREFVRKERERIDRSMKVSRFETSCTIPSPIAVPISKSNRQVTQWIPHCRET